MRQTEPPDPKPMKGAQSKPSTATKQSHDLLTLLESPNSGAKLSLFADWAAGRDPLEIQTALRSLDSNGPPTPPASTSTRPKAKLYILPRRSS